MKASAVLFVTIGAFATTSYAHVDLDYPPMRAGNQKLAQCGSDKPAPTRDNVTFFSPGQTITVRWTETISHTGYQRIAIDMDGQDDFLDPVAVGDSGNNPTIVADNIPDGDGTYEITLPNMECDNCTLQLTQVMTDKDLSDFPAGDMYYRCADIVLTNDPEGWTPPAGTGPDGGTDPGNPSDDVGGCSAPIGAAGLLLLLPAFFLRKRA